MKHRDRNKVAGGGGGGGRQESQERAMWSF